MLEYTFTSKQTNTQIVRAIGGTHVQVPGLAAPTAPADGQWS
jgi:hypothetical protein